MMTAMKSAQKEMKKQYKTIDINKIERMQDDMADMIEDASEIQVWFKAPAFVSRFYLLYKVFSIM